MKKSGLKREEIFLETKLWPSFYEQEDAVEKTLEELEISENLRGETLSIEQMGKLSEALKKNL